MAAWLGRLMSLPALYQQVLSTSLTNNPLLPPAIPTVGYIDSAHQFEIRRATWTRNLVSPISHNRGAAVIMPTYGNDLFDHWLIVPPALNLGNLLADETEYVEVANLFGKGHTMLNVTNNVTGLTIDNAASIPTYVEPYSSFKIQVSISTSGPATITGNLTLSFDYGSAISVPVTGQRVTLFPWDPEQGYTEQLQWKTDVIESYNGTEQRISVRLHPRQVLSYEVFAVDPVQDAMMRLTTFNWLARVWGVPIWWEQQPMTAPLDIGGSVISVDTSYADYRVGGLVFVQNPSKQWEAFQIETMTSNSIQINSVATYSYPIGSKVMPCRTAYAKTLTQAQVFAGGQEKFKIQFTTLDNVGLSNTAGFTMYDGFPVLDDVNFIESTLQEGMGHSHVTIIDNYAGQLYQVSSVDRARPTTKKTWWTGSGSGINPIAGIADSTGREQIWTVRGFLHWAQGSQQVFWLPTNRDDFQIAADIEGGGTTIRVQNTNFSVMFVGRPFGDLRVTLTNGTRVYAQILGVSYDSTTGTEVISLSNQISPTLVPQADVQRIELVQLVRIADDRATFTHDIPGRAMIQVNLVGVKS